MKPDRTNVALPQPVHALLKARCERDGTHLTTTLKRIVLEWLKNGKRNK